MLNSCDEEKNGVYEKEEVILQNRVGAPTLLGSALVCDRLV